MEPTLDQVAEAHADEADLHAAVVQLIEEGLDLGNEDVIGRGIGNACLEGTGIEVGVAHLDSDAGCELAPAPKLVGEVLGHGDEDAFQLFDVGGVLGEGAFGGDGFALVEGDDRAGVDAVGLAPNGGAVLAEDLLHQFDGHFLDGLDALDPEVAQRLVGLGADHGDFANGEGREEGAFSAVVDFEGAGGFGLSGGHLADGFAGAHAE